MKEEHPEKIKENSIVNTIKYHIDNNLLINIKRDKISDETIVGFPISVSDKVIVISQIFDFHYEGVVILRLSDITEAFSTNDDVFFEKICKLENLPIKYKETFKYGVNVHTFYQALNMFKSLKKFVTIQCEHLDNELSFSIGIINDIGKNLVKLRNFDRLGVWDNDLRVINITDISLICIDDYYSNIYYKYMKRLNMIKK